MRPPVEPRSRAARIDAGRGAEMLSKIEEDVDQSVADLPWGRQRAGMVPVAPHGPAPPPDAIERAGHATGEAIDAGTQAVAGGRLHDEMNVIGLNREMDDAKVCSIG